MTDLVRVTYSGGPAGDWLTQFRIDRLLGSDAQDSVDTVQAFFTALRDVMSNQISVHVSGSVEILDPSSGEPTGIDSVTSRVVSPTADSNALPWQTQGLILWNTGTWIGGRQVRGRTFVPAAVENNNSSGGQPDATYLSTLATAAAVISSATTCTPGIFSRKHPNMYPIVSHTVEDHWAVMRTRR